MKRYHRIRITYKGNSAVQRVHYILCKNMQFTGQKAEQPASTACLLARKCNRLARKMAANMRNAICVRTQTSKIPTQDILLVSSLFCGGISYMLRPLSQPLIINIKYHAPSYSKTVLLLSLIGDQLHSL